MIRFVFIPSGMDASGVEGLSDSVEGSVSGTLFDDAGTPRASFGGARSVHGRIHGFALDVDNADPVDMLMRIDLLHGAPILEHVRTIVPTPLGPAHAWHWTGSRDLPIVESGRWPADDQQDLPGIGR